MFGSLLSPTFVTFKEAIEKSQCMEDVMATDRASGEGFAAIAFTWILSSSSR